MEKNKKAGIDHRKNKTKYKNKNKIVSKENKFSHNVSENEDRDISSGKLENNWYRYEKRDDIDTKDLSRDFSILSNAAIYQGNFEFKSDKIIAEDTSNLLTSNKYFDLDLNLLGLSIGTIAFCERCDISEKYFNDVELAAQKTESEKEKHSYEILLKSELYSTKLQDDLLLCKNTEKALKSISAKTEPKEDTKDLVHIEQPMNILQSITKGAPNLLLNSSKQDETEDLEQWLDDILDD